MTEDVPERPSNDASDQLEVEDPGLGDLARQVADDALQREAAVPETGTERMLPAGTPAADIQSLQPAEMQLLEVGLWH